jgi:ribosomal subunit interface protein
MLIQINTGEFKTTPALEERVNDRVGRALQHVADRVTRVEVHVRDDNRHKAGQTDKRVTMEARIAGRQPLVVEDAGDDIYTVVDSAAEKLGRAVKRELERMAER